MRIPAWVGLPVVVVLLGLAVWRFMAHEREHPAAEPVPVKCPACGHEFVPEAGDASPVCPNCGARADVRLLYFKCGQCGAVFVAYEADPTKGLVREPGGEWMPKEACPLQCPCPDCGSKNTYFVTKPDKPAEKPLADD